MQRLGLVALFVVLGAGCSYAQQAGLSMTPEGTPAQSERVKVDSVGPGVTAPVLLPLDLGPAPTDKCKKKVDGRVELSLLVDTKGQARNIMFIKPLGTEVDRFALRVAGADRFQPGTAEGKAVVVGQSLDMQIQSCLTESKDSAGKKIYSLRLRSVPRQVLGEMPSPANFPNRPDETAVLSGTSSWNDTAVVTHPTAHVGGNVKAPVPLNSPAARYTDEARKARINGVCLISLIVDTQGMPENVRVIRSLDPGLDQNAIFAVNSYRFRPALRDGEPVPVMISVEVNFRLY
jgi:TonB family protein